MRTQRRAAVVLSVVIVLLFGVPVLGQYSGAVIVPSAPPFSGAINPGPIMITNGNGTCALATISAYGITPVASSSCPIIVDAGTQNTGNVPILAIPSTGDPTCGASNPFLGALPYWSINHTTIANSSGCQSDQVTRWGYNSGLDVPDAATLRWGMESDYASNFEHYLEWYPPNQNGANLPDGGNASYRPIEWLVNERTGAQTSGRLDISDSLTLSTTPYANPGHLAGNCALFSVDVNGVHSNGGACYTDGSGTTGQYLCTVPGSQCIGQVDTANDGQTVALVSKGVTDDAVVIGGTTGKAGTKGVIGLFSENGVSSGWTVTLPHKGGTGAFGDACFINNGDQGAFAGLEGISTGTTTRMGTLGAGFDFKGGDQFLSWAPLIKPDSIGLNPIMTNGALPTCTPSTKDPTHAQMGDTFLIDAGSGQVKECKCAPGATYCSLTWAQGASMVCTGGTATNCP